MDESQRVPDQPDGGCGCGEIDLKPASAPIPASLVPHSAREARRASVMSVECGDGG